MPLPLPTASRQNQLCWELTPIGSLLERGVSQASQRLDVTAAEHGCGELGCSIPAAQLFSCDDSSQSDDEALLREVRITEVALHHPICVNLRDRYRHVLQLVAPAYASKPLLPEDMLAYLSHRHPVWAGVAHAGLRQIYDTDPVLFKQWVKSFDRMLRWDADPLGGPLASRRWWQLLSEARQTAHWFQGYDLIHAFIPTHARDAIRMSPCGPMSAELHTALLKTRIVSIVAQQVYRF